MPADIPEALRQSGARTVPMGVLAFGWPRTGTTSLRKALETLGYRRTNHGADAFTIPAQMDMWIAACKAKFHGEGKPYGREEWDVLLGDCQAVTDVPHVLFAEDLMAAYPDAKIVLNTRDLDSWWRSFEATAMAVAHGQQKTLLEWLDPEVGKSQLLKRLVTTALFKTGTGTVTEDIAKKHFTEYYSKIKQLAPKERLLEYDVKEGWSPLCAFLGRDIPEEPFPRVNDKEQFLKSVAAYNAAILRRVLKKFIGPFFTIVCVGVGLFIYAGID